VNHFLFNPINYAHRSAAVLERRAWMKKIIVLDADDTQCQSLCSMLEEENYPAVPARSLIDLEKYFEAQDCLGVFIDVDTVPITNRDLRNLSIKNPRVYLFCLSKYRFHPALKDGICHHVYACLNRPIDPDELFYWLRSIYQDDEDPKDVSGN